MATPKISIVIPSFNKGRYIEETLSSIFSQQYKNFEVIIIDGGSKDGTLSVVDKFIRKFPHKIYFESKSDDGQLWAINRGLQKASGEIVTFINADDVYLGEAFRKVSEVYNGKYIWYAGGGVVISDKSKQFLGLITGIKNLLLRLNNYNLLLMVNYIMQPSVFLSKRAISDFGGFSGNKNFVMEYEMWLKLGKISMPYIINSNISAFRISPGSITSSMSQKLLQEDERIVLNFTNNILILFVHKMANIIRKLIIRII